MQLERLTKIELRDVWSDEAADFTPWLGRKENIEQLSEAIGSIDLEVLGEEERIGPFRADLWCKDTVSGQFVIVENQLGKTDHKHLGQLMTYAAGLDAFTAVWIAGRFAEEHRAALDWLNSVTREDVNFFGVEIELNRIGNSAAAPRFNIVSKPNDWAKATRENARAAELTPAKELQLQFWQAFKERMEERNSPVRPRKAQPQNWTSFAIGSDGFFLSASINSREQFARAWLVISGDSSSDYFHQLKTEWEADARAEIAAELQWDEKPDGVESHIGMKRPGDPSNPEQWPELQEWLAESLEKLYAFFKPKIKTL